MSLLRVRHPDHPPRDIDLGPSTGRITMSRLGIRGGGPPIVGSLAVGESQKTIADRQRREYNARTYRPGVSEYVDDFVKKNPDNGAVEAPIIEVQT